jgi:HEPN domain-containing protein
MKDDTTMWLNYADQNIESARVLFDSRLFNPCLQNVQQAVEKALKALLVESSIKFRKTHSINELTIILSENGIDIELGEDERDLLDSIYLPSKYPLGGVIPEFEPDSKICQQCLGIAENVMKSVRLHLKSS